MTTILLRIELTMIYANITLFRTNGEQWLTRNYIKPKFGDPNGRGEQDDK